MSQSRRVAEPTERMQGTVAAPAFDLDLSMTCGQIFGWKREDGAFLGVIGDAAVMVRQTGDRVSFVSDRGVSPGRVASYLGLDEDLDAIIGEIARDAFMRRVTGTVKGLRILRQEPWPCLCSYILSANNRVERIDRLVKEIASKFGTRHEFDGNTVYSLPGPEELAGCGEAGVRSCGTGFRAPYLIKAASMIARGEVDLESVRTMAECEGREALKRLPGVGDKVADCVQLFAFSKYRAFPIDVWIKRVMERVYFHGCEMRSADIRDFAQAYLGGYAGYAQEYIYAYAREFGLDW
jgi:N-glycosylase/DNA lyase